jgi:hypothetical protein
VLKVSVGTSWVTVVVAYKIVVDAPPVYGWETFVVAFEKPGTGRWGQPMAAASPQALEDS